MYGMMYGMVKTTVYLPERLKQALERAACAERKSEAELIREGIESVTKKHRYPKPKVPLFKSNLPPDAAENVDKYLEGFGEL